MLMAMNCCAVELYNLKFSELGDKRCSPVRRLLLADEILHSRYTNSSRQSRCNEFTEPPPRPSTRRHSQLLFLTVMFFFHIILIKIYTLLPAFGRRGRLLCVGAERAEREVEIMA